MRGSLWKYSQLQCKLAPTEESRGLKIQNQLLDDMKAELQKFPKRRDYTDVEREGIPPSDTDSPQAAPRVVQEEEDRNTALVPTLPHVTSPPPSLPELDSESHRSFREALQGESVLVIWTVIVVIAPRLKIPEIRVGPCRKVSCHVKWVKMCKKGERSSLSTQ